MKLTKLATLFTCTSLLAFTLTAAPTHLRYIEFEDSEILTHVKQDENEMTQVSVQVNDEKHEFTFTPEELKDINGIESRLALLPEQSRIKLATLLSRMNKGGEHSVHIIQTPGLDPKLERKLQALAIKMEGKEAEMHKIVIKLESKAAEIEAHALEFESLQELHEEEFEVAIEALEQHVSEIVSNIDDIDIDFDEMDSDGSRIIIIGNDNEDKHVEHLIRAIKASELTDKEKQAIKEALN